MYIRRKVFSRFIDENGDERLFSTTEFEKDFSDMIADMEREKRKTDAFFDNDGTVKSRRQMNRDAKETSRIMESGRLRDQLDEVNAKNGYNSSNEAKDLQAKIDKLSPKAKENILKRLYGKDAAHRGRNIALTAAGTAAAAGAGYGIYKAVKAKKAKKKEENKKK